MIKHPNKTTLEKVWLHYYIPVILYMIVLSWIPVVSAAKKSTDRIPYTIVDTAQIRCYSNNTEIEFPKAGAAFFGQDAHYAGNEPAYKDNTDATATDLNTGLMWQCDPGEKMTFNQAVAGASKCRTGGYEDWRLPTIKELYSLILFSGTDPDPMSRDSSRQQPFIDTKYFKFRYGSPNRGERIIDSQFATGTKYISTTMRGDETMFGVNFADGRIKGYGMRSPRTGGDKTFHVLYVRGNTSYGKNNFKDNGDGTITDEATGLMWMKVDSGKLRAGKNGDGKLNWQEALDWAENLQYAGYSGWRLPNVKELQSIVDYTRSPATTNSAAIDPVFKTTSFIAEGGQKDYPCYWSGTTHAGLSRASTAAYVAFGRSFGWMRNRRTGQYMLMDVHGAGSQRSDPKS
ncbi:MAG: Lcl C-terminal domain-containing protein, partial [Planctomycetota bacterium]